MVLIIAVAIVAVLSYAATSLRTVTQIRNQRLTTYVAEGGVQTAIQAVRSDVSEGANGNPGDPCLSSGLTYSALGKSASVTCTVEQARGPATPQQNAPAYAIQAVGSSGSETGILEQSGGSQNKKIIVGGAVASNSPAVPSVNSIDVINLIANGYVVLAKGSCAGTIQVSDPTTDLKCNTGQDYPDPNYPEQPLPDANVAANFNPPPVCKTNNGKGSFEFQPGYYTDVDFLENPQSHVASGSCANAEWFAPGVYFFDFDFDPTKNDAVWNMAGTIVGGEPKNWNPDSGTPNINTANNGVSRWCKTEKDNAGSGVQFVLGGNSQISNGGAVVELCADPTPTGTNQQIAIYGQKSGSSSSPVTITRSPSGTPTQPPAPAPQFANPNDALVIEQGVTTPVLSAKTPDFTGTNSPPKTAALTLGGFAGVVVPPGAVAVSYDLQVSHEEGSTKKNDFANGQGPTIQIGSCNVQLTPQNTMSVEHPALPACFAAAVAGAGNFSATYSVTPSNNNTVHGDLDGIKLNVTYTPFVVRAQQGAVTQLNGVAALTVSGNNTTFVVWGTVYMPLTKIVADFKNNSVFEFRRGVIARAMQNLSVPPADTSSAFCIGYGINCSGPSRVFRFTATVDGSVRLVAMVQFIDSPSIGYSTSVLSWNQKRST
jgi:hypothetical protein